MSHIIRDDLTLKKIKAMGFTRRLKLGDIVPDLVYFEYRFGCIMQLDNNCYSKIYLPNTIPFWTKELVTKKGNKIITNKGER